MCCGFEEGVVDRKSGTGRGNMLYMLGDVLGSFHVSMRDFVKGFGSVCDCWDRKM